MRILIVEDDAMFAFAIEDALSTVGHEIVGFARDRDSAVELADRERPDLVLMDLRLARQTSGAVAAREIRERCNIPSIFISSSPEDCRKEAKPTGAWGCLSKPFTDRDLVNVVEIAAAMMTGHQHTLRPRGFEFYPAG